MLLSIIIPAQNEERHIEATATDIVAALDAAGIPHELIIVNDNSTDATERILGQLAARFPSVRYVNNHAPAGFGRAIKRGLEEFRGDAVVIAMADASDDPADIVAYYRKLSEGYDCVFGTRFGAGRVGGYPRFKYFLNRAGNRLIKKVFHIAYDDITNAFKCYRREVITAAQPVLSNHFNITVELPVKAMIYGYSYAVIPVRWKNRKYGVSKLHLRNMVKQYLLIVFFLFLNRYISER